MANTVVTAETAIETWIPHTKLAPDLPAGEHIARPQLVNALHTAISSHRLTLLSSPPGFGKSTLLSLWAGAQLDGTDGSPMRIAWLSLDASENDRTHFLLALIAALQTLHPKCGRRAKAFLTQNGYPEPIDAATLSHIIGGLMIIDIMQYAADPFALVFDGYERVTEPTVHEALDFLIRRLPPNARVVISTTRNPPKWLARLRAYGLLAEFGAKDLAYTEDECAKYVRDSLGSDLLPQHVASLYSFTEGWPAGVRMVVKGLQRLSTPEERVRFLDELGTHLTDHVPPPALDAYFEQAIFQQLRPSLRTFLVQTSVLPQLDADRCQAVTGASDAGELLDEVIQRNLFVVHAAPNGSSPSGDLSFPLRYHRSFSAFLQARLDAEMPGQARVLHGRAAQAEKEPVYRTEHLIAAGSWSEAAEMIQSMLDTAGLCDSDIGMLMKWVNRMPDEVRSQYPELVSSVNARSMPEAARNAGLTERQYQVLTLLAAGASNQEIANELVVALPTVKGHVGQVLRKLDVSSRRQVAERATDLGLLQS